MIGERTDNRTVESVETEGELAWARENGATFAQGYLIARTQGPPVRSPTRTR